ncbi:MAG: NAD(P)/FAD-dependent oxidoreductase, partial [Bacteroidota bacterium]
MKILIVGQGIAGSVLAHLLSGRGCDVHLADAGMPGSSSRFAAGIINPVTGKRFVKSWNFDIFFPVAMQVYREMESLAGASLIREYPVVRLLAAPGEVNDWSARCAQPDYTDHVRELHDAREWGPVVKPGFHFGEISRAARVDFPQLLQAVRKRWNDEGRFLFQAVVVERIDDWLSEFDKVIFTEGFRGQFNELFPTDLWRVAKGEALIIRFPDFQGRVFNSMLKKTAIIAPLGDDTFWVGGTYQWYFPDFAPSSGERDFLIGHLNEMLGVPYEIIDHVAGVRPTVKDRRPLIGESPVKKDVLMFNGMGTKGALLAPYWATHLVNHLLDGEPIDSEVSLLRACSEFSHRVK